MKIGIKIKKMSICLITIVTENVDISEIFDPIIHIIDYYCIYNIGKD